MSVTDEIAIFIEQNTPYIRGIDIFVDHLPETKDNGIVVHFVQSETKWHTVKAAIIAIYYFSKDWTKNESEMEKLKKIIAGHRGLSGVGWSVMSEVEMGNEGEDNANRRVISLNFKVGYVEEE